MPSSMHRPLQRHQDLARCHAVHRHLVVEAEGARVELERGGAAGVDDLEPEAAGGVQGPGDVVVDAGLLGAVAQHAQQEVVVAEDGKSGLVDDRDVRQFRVDLAGVQRQHRGLDHGGEAHLRIAIAGVEADHLAPEKGSLP